jgi:hypothetical protein
MDNVKSLLTNTMNPQNRLMQETRGLVAKWDKTGLLESLKNDVEKSNMAVLLENQAKQLIEEATSTGTSANSEQWAGVALPLVRRVFAEIAAKEFVSVQPMNLPSGLVFYLDFKYGTNQGQFKKDGSTLSDGSIATSSLYGGTGTIGGTGQKLGSTDAAIGGLYGAGRFGYTVNDKLTTATVLVSSASYEDINYDVSLSSSLAAGKIWKVATTNLFSQTTTAGNVFDANGVRSFVLYGPAVSASLFTPNNTSASFYPALTKQFGTEVIFVLSASATLGGAVGMSGGGAPGTAPAWSVIYSVQPKDSNRGDFEDRGTPDATFGLNNDIGIPEVNLELKSEPIVAKTRKLKAVWTPELAQDMNAYHSIDAEAELTALLSEYVSMEIDLEILDMLITNAPAITTERWSAKLNREIQNNGDGTFSVVDQTVAGTGGYYTKDTWYRTLGIKIQKVSNTIHQLTLRGGANFLVCSPSVATILESIPGWQVNTDGDQAKFAMGVSRVGSFASRFQVYKNPYMTDNVILMGFRGNNFLETGAVYAPYIPLVQTPLVYDPVNFTPRRGVMTRYAKKIVRPEFYGRIMVADLNAV